LSWTNQLAIDFTDYKFKKLASETDYNELLLALFSETETFKVDIPLHALKAKMLAENEKH